MQNSIPKIPLVEQVNSYLPGDSVNQHPLRQAIRQVLREQARTRIVPLIALSLAGFAVPALGQQAMVNLASLDGSNGFVFDDLIAGDYSGFSGQLGIPVSAAGDINDDGIDDFLVGTPFSSPNGSQSGASYVVFGASEVGSGGTLAQSDLDGSNGFVLNGVVGGDKSGDGVSI